MTLRRKLRQTGPPTAFVLIVIALTCATHVRGGVALHMLATSPARTAEGKLWLLLSSGLIVDHPVVISLVSFGALAAAALALTGPRAFWLAALLGHVASTLAVYGFIGVSRAVSPGAWDSALNAPDYGVSAISAAWLGAIAAVCWRRRGASRTGKAAIAAACVAAGLFAYSLRPDVTILSSEHLLAFVLGILIVSPELRGAIARLRPQLPARADPIAAPATALAVTLVAIALAPSALGDLTEQLQRRSHPSLAACISSWNRSSQAARNRLAANPVGAYVSTSRALLVPRRHHPKWADYCSYTFAYPGARLVQFEAVWRHGHTGAWRQALLHHAPAPAPANARLLDSGRLLRI
jgi:hypothetical protein